MGLGGSSTEGCFLPPQNYVVPPPKKTVLAGCVAVMWFIEHKLTSSVCSIMLDLFYTVNLRVGLVCLFLCFKNVIPVQVIVCKDLSLK